MARYNICLAQPEGYIHSEALIELAELLLYSLNDLGHTAILQRNKIDSSVRNIMIGTHLLAPQLIPALPKDSILINTEQLSSAWSEWNQNILKWFSAGFELWEYNDRNIEYLNNFGLDNVRKFNIGYQKELRRISIDQTSQLDVLFYGTINPRRKNILERIHQSGVKLKILMGVYGKERDDWIARSKIVLNCHCHDAQIFEIVRIFYLLTNSIAVVGEVNSTTNIDTRLREALMTAPYEDLVSKVRELVGDRAELDNWRKRGFEIFSQFPQSSFTRELLR